MDIFEYHDMEAFTFWTAQAEAWLISNRWIDEIYCMFYCVMSQFLLGSVHLDMSHVIMLLMKKLQQCGKTISQEEDESWCGKPRQWSPH